MSLPLYLASTSPRRRELLLQLGLSFSVLSIHVDEQRFAEESPEQYVVRLAQEKARAGAMQVTEGLVMAADTTVVLGNDVLGKPVDQADAMAMWQRLSGREHQVMTAVAVAKGAELRYRLVKTAVQFRPISQQEMQAYWATGEPCDKAGGYAIQGKGALFVQAIVGSYSNVVGLPLLEATELLAEFSWPVWPDVPAEGVMHHE